MISLPQIAAAIVAAGSIGGSALYLDKAHVSVSQFELYLDAEQSKYVLALKQDIRQVKMLLRDDPDDEYLIEDLAEMVDTLCEIRPDDKLCDND